MKSCLSAGYRCAGCGYPGYMSPGLREALLADDHVFQQIVNHLRCEFNEEHLAGYHDALVSNGRWWKAIDQRDSTA
jgi:hypothetical protein